MKPIVDEQDIINTYSTAEQFSCKKYTEYQKLIKENPSFGYKKAAKLLGVKQGRTRWWHTKGVKRAIPLPLKVVEKLKSAGLLPFDENHKDAKIIFNMLGVLFGDGGIDLRYNTVAFISSDKMDIDLWHADLLRLFPFAKGKTQIVEGGEFGHSYNVRCYDRAVVRFFAAIGAPVGDKVTINYSLPKWLANSSEQLCIEFLDGYLAAEVSVVRWRPDSLGNKRFTDFSVGISKIESLENEHREYLKSVEGLLDSVGVPTTGNIHKNYSAGNHRKDGLVTANYRIFIRTTFHRVLFFNQLFQLRYAQGKKERFGKVIAGAIEEKEAKKLQKQG
ncbi:MAG: hypothetical protein AABW99_04655 [archaeon]